MPKEKQIECLDKFIELIRDWQTAIQKGDHKAIQKIEEELQLVWGIIEEIFGQFGVQYSGELVDHRMKGLKNPSGNYFIDGFVGMDRHSTRVTNIEKLQGLARGVKSKIANTLPLVANTLPSVHQVINILRAFPDIVSRMEHRRKGKESYLVNDEYDVQDLIYVMLKGPFPTLQYENPNNKVGVNSSSSDFNIDELSLFIEAKIVSEKGKEKQIQEQCKHDIISYSKQSNCNKIIFFVYDPKKCIDNEHAFKDGLGQKIKIEDKEVEIITLVIR